MSGKNQMLPLQEEGSINITKNPTKIDDAIKGTSENVEEILDYTDEEKAQIDDIMEIVYKLDDKEKDGKNIANTLEYNMFILSYKKLSQRLKNHFLEIYNEFVIKVGVFKIKRALSSPLPKGDYDIPGIKVEILNIKKSNKNFDFSIFESELLYDILKELENER